ncbi:MAG: UvrD-helicase domain-containing protein [Leptospiraceae bacterium]|nr:UvrD-helicase domain-containing protein [Leptospiraceae bacterium]
MSLTGLKDRIEAELLEPLNEVQRNAVLHDTGPLLIVAGAGSGKTRVITHRIAYLARIRDVRPYSIAAVTFTNKAAEEMRERLYHLMGPMAENVFVRTFHSLGLHILTRHAEEAGLKSGFSIFDTQAQKSLIKTILKERKLEGDAFTPASVAHRINQARDTMVGPDEYTDLMDDFYADEIAAVYRVYIERLRGMNAVDFGDLLYMTVRLFQHCPDVLEKYRNIWRYFMIDEYQDTNHVQYLIGRSIAREHSNIMVVGDDDQSIYSWRGADISNILSFEKDYEQAKILRLEENYRSGGNILKAAASLIVNNSERREKTLFTRQEAGRPLAYQRYMDDQEESRAIINQVRTLQAQGQALKNMAVFYRTNAQSRSFETALRELNVPYVLVGDIRFYERKEIKDLIAYLTVIINPQDDVSLERIINVPARGVGATGLERLQNLARSRGVTLLEAMPSAGEIPNFRAARKMESLYKRFREWQRAHREGELPSIIADRVLKESGYLDALKQDTSPEARGRIENLYEFVGSLQEYEKEFQNRPETDAPIAPAVDATTGETMELPPEERARPDRPDLLDFLQKIALHTSSDTVAVEAATDFLYLMTLHNAKGLEFPVVFITGMEEGFIPHSLSVDEGGLEEERRLMYVGITRAREHLFLSSCRRRRVFGQYQDRLPSRFLEEMDASVFAPGQSPALQRGSTPRAGNGVGGIRWQVDRSQRTESYRDGERIEHPKYGLGTIAAVERTVAGEKLAVVFDAEDDRERYFLAAYTPLRRIS